MISKPFDDISKADIDAMQEPEGREIEYKAMLPGNSDDDKREFLADASSFANATGGDMLFGIESRGGIPTAAPGVVCTSSDAEILRLENVIRDGLDPRLLGLRTKAVPGFANGPVILMRIPKSWASPHMISFKKLSRFFTRNSAGKHQMDVTEIRSAFLLSEGLADRLRRFRDKRLAMIISGEPAATMPTNSLVVCHLLPLVDAEIKLPFDLRLTQELRAELHPLGYSFGSDRYNIDGFLVQYDLKTQCQGYCQLFRTGAVETVNAKLLTVDAKMLYASRVEQDIITAVESYMPLLERFGVPFPLVFACSLFGVKGMKVYTGYEMSEFDKPMVDRNQINLPDVLFENAKVDIRTLLRPAFDALWQAGGYPASPNYDTETGKWGRRERG